MSDDGLSRRPITDSISSPDGSTATLRLPSSSRLMWWGLWIEGGCLLGALVLGSLGFYNRDQPLHHFFRLDMPGTISWTLLGLLATFAIAAMTLLIPLRPFREFRDFVYRFVLPVFEPLSVGQIALLSAGAGMGEEMLFRWCLQGGLQTAFFGLLGTVGALCVASVLFGLCHAMSFMYVVVATLIGGVLGAVMLQSGSVVPAILTHGIYDFVAILVLREAGRAKARRDPVLDRTPE